MSEEIDMTRVNIELRSAHTSPDIRRAVGRWLEVHLLDSGFRWVDSRAALQHVSGHRLERIVFYSSSKNRPGRSVRITVDVLEAHDVMLGRWRRVNPGLTVQRPEGVVNLVCAGGFMELWRRPGGPWLEFVNEETRVDRLAELLSAITSFALPWFESTRSPEHLADRVTDGLLRSCGADLVEYAVSAGQAAEARRLVSRFRGLGGAAKSALQEGVELAESGGVPAWKSPVTIGWTARMLNLI